MAPEIDTDLTTLLHAQVPFAAELGLQATAADATRVTAVCEWLPSRCTTGEVLHGGYLMAVADTAGAICAVYNIPKGATTATIESKTNFFRPVTGGSIEIVASPIHVGSTVIAIQTDVTNDEGKLVSRTVQTQAVRPPG